MTGCTRRVHKHERQPTQPAPPLLPARQPLTNPPTSLPACLVGGGDDRVGVVGEGDVGAAVLPAQERPARQAQTATW